MGKKRLRDMTWEDYGISKYRYQELKAFCLQYPEKKEKIKYGLYAGTQEEWSEIFKEYKSTKVEDAEGAEDKGKALADKLNKMMGHEYDSSLFEYFFSASPDDLR